MNKDKRNNIKLLGTLNNTDESGIIANANQIYDANEDKSTQDVSKEHKERIETLETKENSMQTTLENITKTGEASAASNVTYNHSDSKLDATNVQQAVDEVRKKSNYNDGDDIIDFNTIHLITKSSKYIYALVDGNENLILGILRSNCHIVYGNGIPDEVKEYIDNQINKILGTEDISSTIDSLKEIENFLKDFSNSDTLKVLLDSQNSKIEDVLKRSNPNSEDGGIVNTKDIMSFVKSKKYYKVLTDGNDNIIEAILSNGSIKDYIPRNIQGNILYTSCNKKYVWALLDSNDNFIVGINRSNGKIEYGNGLPKEVEEKINEAIGIANKYSSDSVNNLSDIIFKTFGIKDTNGNFLTMSTLLSVVDSKKYSEVKLDGNENIIEVRHKKTGIKESFLPVKIQGTELSVISSNKYIFALLDGSDNFIIGLNRENAKIEYGNGIPNEVQKAIENHIPNLEGYATKDYVDKNAISDIEKESIKDYNLPVPAYYNNYLTEKIAKFNELFKNDSAYNAAFVFITDVHYPSNRGQSPALIKYILRHTLIRKVFYGGDSDGINDHKGTTSKTAVYDFAKNFVEWFCKPLQPYCQLYLANGNHDFSAVGLNGDTSYTAPLTLSRQVYMDNTSSVIFNKDDEDCVYYYFDDDVQKIRYVIVNTSSTYLGKDNKSGSQWITFNNKQKKWLTENAIKTTPKGYDLIVIGHVPPTTPEDNYLPNLQNYLECIQNKSSITIDNTIYDLSDAPNILLTLWGHQHVDEISYQGGFPICSFACDAAYPDYKHFIFGDANMFPNKSKGTIYEQTFDLIYINKEKNIATSIRIGGGYDRTIHLGVNTIKVGQTLVLTTDIDSPIWNICDGKDNPNKDGYISSINKTVASIDNGTVTGLKIGYSTACAYNSDTGEMEIWGIEVQ